MTFPFRLKILGLLGTLVWLAMCLPMTVSATSIGSPFVIGKVVAIHDDSSFTIDDISFASPSLEQRGYTREFKQFTVKIDPKNLALLIQDRIVKCRYYFEDDGVSFGDCTIKFDKRRTPTGVELDIGLRTLVRDFELGKIACSSVEKEFSPDRRIANYQISCP